MQTILGIDAAWTLTEPSGVALLTERDGRWHCVDVAPSYLEFIAQSEGRRTNWLAQSFSGTEPDAARLLRAAETLASCPVHLVALDMPIATVPISNRRKADDEISREFGSRGCSTHTPSVTRPGPLGTKLSGVFHDVGFPLKTVGSSTDTPALIEVYPHPALLSLLKRGYRVPYKVSKSGKYWPGKDVFERIDALLAEFSEIYNALVPVVGPIPFDLPAASTVDTLQQLKRYEDALDAIVCAWIGIEHLSGRTIAFGDDTAAIWCPVDVVAR